MSELVTRYVCGDDEQCGVCVECAMLSQGAELEGMRQRVAELEADKARLDWLQHNALAVTESTDLREAIDAAMAQQKEGASNL